MKECTVCKEVKEDDAFVYNSARRKIHNRCHECNKKMARDYRQANRDYVSQYKLSKGCEECGFKAVHSCQLDLDHIDPETKTYKGSHKAYDAGWTREKVDAEIKKCRVLCKNCHALRSYQEGHWENEHTSIRMRQSSAQI